MNKYRASTTLLPYLENVLTRKAISYHVEYIEEKPLICTEISGVKFHKFVVRAKMEKMQDEDKSPVPYITKQEANDPDVLKDVGTAYVIK